MTRSAVFLSPHLDDAAFSAGSTLAQLVADGWRVDLVTVFTRSVPDPAGFALACQLDKGLPADADYLALRRREDLAAAARLGLARDRVHHLDLPEAPHRGYGSAAELFAGVRPADRGTEAAVSAAIRGFCGADRVYLPHGLGNHADHLHVIAAARSAVPPGRRLHWLDTPYVLRCGVAERTRGEAVPARPAALAAKLDACAAYTTQLGFQFGGEAAMRETLSELPERFVAGA
ncbi:PIG-L deacetylase family protein [Phycisphaera mikurensis]|uniref:Deacetylase n=1 Tax=Phycisphaera mikurensis (strain NBRC 102666 / KCTC 22515 / FYK2301M01) TaxID=1142394 RepID=I0IFM7_PHYMF|nr:PIG-L family deacetylase [Phycisphaera mikurensis]MBB6440545.1 LmbE family N-acetylglucosaminyl deacetylase [Phycisphaera mikurensis]BAM04065.1 hypothetical protein PSMK_19060 [Phycisphaera mikurensis NBRC 102666]